MEEKDIILGKALKIQGLRGGGGGGSLEEENIILGEALKIQGPWGGGRGGGITDLFTQITPVPSTGRERTTYQSFKP